MPFTLPVHPVVPEHETLRQIGMGNFGEVWLIRSQVGVLRAAKIVRREKFSSERSFQRDLEGLRLFEPVSRTHPGFVQILQIGQNLEQGWAYSVMELADPENPTPNGFDASTYAPRTLASDLAKRSRIPAMETIALGLSLADALDHLHQNRLLHRDIKPANIIFGGGSPKLADIGLVAAFEQAGSMVGTPGYVPPEGHRDERGDVYSLGKVLYECCWGQDRQVFPVVPSQAIEWPDHAQLIELNEVILKACESNPDLRYASAADLREDLRQLQRGISLRAQRLHEKYWKQLTRLAVIVIFIALLAITGLWLQRSQNQRTQALSDQIRNQLIQLNVANGSKMVAEGQWGQAALWFAEAVSLSAGNPDQEWENRFRFRSTIDKNLKLHASGSHEGRIRCLEFSRDGRVFGTAGEDGTVRLWSAATGTALGTPLVHPHGVEDISFSPDGHRLAAGCVNGSLWIWVIDTHVLQFSGQIHAQSINKVSFSPDGTKVGSSSDDCTVQIRSADTGNLVAAPLLHNGPANTVEFSTRNNAVVTSADDGTARIWLYEAPPTTAAILEHPSDVRSARFSPDGSRVITACKNGNAEVWDVQSGKSITGPLSVSVPLWTATFSKDGNRILAAGGDGDVGGRLAVWDLGETAIPLTTIRLENNIRSAEFSPDGRWIATACHDRSMAIWEASTGIPVAPAIRSEDFMKWVAFSPDGNSLLAAGDAVTWTLWDCHHLRSNSFPTEGHTPFQFGVFSPFNNEILCITTNHEIVLQDYLNSGAIRSLGRASSAAASVGFSGNGGRAVAAFEDGEIRVWDLNTGSQLGSFFERQGVQQSHLLAMLNYDGNALIAYRPGQTKTLKIWAVDKPSAPPLVLNFPNWVESAQFSPNGRALLTCSDEKRNPSQSVVQLWSVITGEPLREPITYPINVNAVWSPDGKRICVFNTVSTSSGSFLEIWNTDRAQPNRLWLPARSIHVATCSPDSRFLALGGDQYLSVVEIANGKLLSKHLAFQKGCWNLEWSRDRKILASAGVSNQVWLTSPLTSEPLAPPFHHLVGIRDISFSHAKDWLMISGGDRTSMWRCTIDGDPADELKRKARLATGCKINELGAVEPLSSDELVRLFAHPSTTTVGRDLH